MLQTMLEAITEIPLSVALPLSGAVLGALACFIVMEFFLLKWKRRYRELEGRHRLLGEQLDMERRYGSEKLEMLERTETTMRLQFQNLAQQIFEEKSTLFRHQNSEQLDGLLKPLQEQLHRFRDRVETVFLEETRDHASLKQELLQLRELNQRITEEAATLSRAIAGDRKLQGTWGELVLERLLEQSGLRRGYEYETQSARRNEENRLLKPDVIVHLPDGKDIVIDSKVSLAAWSRYCAATEDEDRSRAMREHLKALQHHLKSLGSKDYSSLPGLRSLDFVLMFVPIDAAYMTAIQANESLIADMYSRKILIVTPTTLLATLRTIEHFWRSERQNRNALEIAERASLLYEKLRGFLEEMEKLGRSIDQCRDGYDRAVNKLSRGRGNVVAQARKFPELGVKVKHDLPNSFSNMDVPSEPTAHETGDHAP